MFRSLFLLPLLFSPLTLAENVDVRTTIMQPYPNTYCASGVCLSINGGAGTGTGTTDAPDPTDSPTEPPTVIVRTPPTCDVCEAGVLVFNMEPTCCPDGSVCDITHLLSSGPINLPTNCDGDGDGNGVITFNACTCTFYCNSTLPTQAPTVPPTYAPTTVAPTTQAPTTAVPTDAPTTQAPTTQAPTTQAPTTPAPTTQAPTTQAPTTQAPTTQAPTTQAPTTTAPTTQAPTTQAPTTTAPTTQAPTTQAPTTQAPTTKAPTTKAPTTKAPTTSAPTTRAPTPTPTPTPTSGPTTHSCSRCNSTHEFFVVFPVCCTNQIVSTCNNNQIAKAAKQLPQNCDEKSITWDGCSCTFYCNATSATVQVNPNHPSNTPVLPVPQHEIETFQVDIKFNITKPNNNTRCIAGTSICITINSAPSQHTMVTFPIIASVMMGLLAML